MANHTTLLYRLHVLIIKKFECFAPSSEITNTYTEGNIRFRALQLPSEIVPTSRQSKQASMFYSPLYKTKHISTRYPDLNVLQPPLENTTTKKQTLMFCNPLEDLLMGLFTICRVDMVSNKQLQWAPSMLSHLQNVFLHIKERVPC